VPVLTEAVAAAAAAAALSQTAHINIGLEAELEEIEAGTAEIVTEKVKEKIRAREMFYYEVCGKEKNEVLTFYCVRVSV
jgi:hypothetical protein